MFPFRFIRLVNSNCLTIPFIRFVSDFVRKKITDTQNAVDKISTSFAAKCIFIGSYKFTSKEKVIFSSLGMRIIAPNPKRDSENVILDIQKSEIVKIACNFGNSSIMYVFVNRLCGLYIRESLEMVRSSEFYYDPSGTSEYEKRIILQVDNLAEEAKATIKSIFSKQILDEISAADAMAMLEKSSANDQPDAKPSIR